MKRKVTPVQENVLREVQRKGQLSRPRSTLEKLQKKGFVSGKRHIGWSLTEAGERWLSEPLDR